MDFGYVASFEESFPIFNLVREESGQSELDFMVGIPGDLDMALFALGPIAAFRNRKAFADTTVNAITAIHRQAGSAVVFQIEIPAELVFVAQMPGPLRPAMAAFGYALMIVPTCSPCSALVMLPGVSPFTIWISLTCLALAIRSRTRASTGSVARSIASSSAAPMRPMSSGALPSPAG